MVSDVAASVLNALIDAAFDGRSGAVEREIRRFRVDGAGLSGGEVFATIDKGVPDGMRMDRDGRLWSSAADGVHVFHPDGTRLGKILVPETVANLCFGGPKGNRLFITATTSVYSLYTRVRGA